MPAGYSTRCKVCNHPRRAEIERWIKEEGISYREAARRLDGAISHEAIRRHCDEHFNIREEAALQYRASQEQLQAMAARRVSEIELLDQAIERAARLNAAAAQWIDEIMAARDKLPKSLVDLFAATAAELRQHAKTKAELLGDSPTDHLANTIGLTLEMLQERYRHARSGEAGADEE